MDKAIDFAWLSSLPCGSGVAVAFATGDAPWGGVCAADAGALEGSLGLGSGEAVGGFITVSAAALIVPGGGAGCGFALDELVQPTRRTTVRSGRK